MDNLEKEAPNRFPRWIFLVLAILLILVGGIYYLQYSGWLFAPNPPVEGPRIAFTAGRDDNLEIYVMKADGSQQTRMTRYSGMDWGPAWSPDGSKIAFYSARGLMVMDADGSHQKRLAKQAGERLSAPSWSPEGTKIAFISARDGNAEVYVIDADGSNPVNLTQHPGQDHEVAWSPDGTKIAFTSRRDSNAEIYVMNADGSQPIRLTHEPGSDYSPSWSPDSKQIAFTSDRDGGLDIYVMNVDGSNVKRITTGGVSWFPVWSPDGLKIAYNSLSHGWDDIFVMDSDGSDIVHLVDHVQEDDFPAWSPDR